MATFIIYWMRRLLDKDFSLAKSQTISFTQFMQSVQGTQAPGAQRYYPMPNPRRYAAHPEGYAGAVRLSEEYALRARNDLDIDDPSIDALQTLLLLSMAFSASGKGKKAYMMLGMSF